VEEIISVRDHTRVCEHGSLWPHWTEVKNAKWWQEPECLGGREMILRRLGDGVWVEVEDGTDRSSTLEAESQ
jgi:hypothetical protein